MAAEIQALLRFLTHDAKLPLSDTLPKISALRTQGLTDAAAIAKSTPQSLKLLFGDDKVAQKVHNAAKRATSSKKRAASDIATTTRAKKVKPDVTSDELDIEARFALPESDLSVEELSGIEIETNRAPLVLAFAVSVLKYTMPEQPISSRLSLAQALVSANSQTKAKSIGLVAGKTADDEGWAEGQPKVKVLGRDIAVLKRYNPPAVTEAQGGSLDSESGAAAYTKLWGLDLEALRKSNGPLVAGKLSGSVGPPIHTPDAARAYLIKSMSIVSSTDGPELTSPAKKSKSLQNALMKEKALSMVLQAIDLLCESWKTTLTTADLDARAWSWYIHVRPDVAQGQAGWGQKGKVRLNDILDLRKT